MTTMQYFFRHSLAEEVREQGREEGVAQERAATVLKLLRLRGIPVTDSVRDRVQACSDLDLLETWVERALHAENAEGLFVDDRT
nr:hypothetical protein OG999_31975 [Streptomyces sp. NBC_00886]